MKSIFILSAFSFIVGCGEPMQVTAHPDDRSATSGTLGSTKAENQLPTETHDSTRTDTLRHN